MRSKGLSLVELLISAAILAFVLCGFLVLFNNCIFLNRSDRNLTTAMSHAQYVMEDIKNTPFAQIEDAITNHNGGPLGWDYLTAPDIAAQGLNPLPNEAINTNCDPVSNPLEVWVDVIWDDPRPMNTGLRTLFN